MQPVRWGQTSMKCWGDEMTHSNCGKQVDAQKSKQLCDLAIPLLVYEKLLPPQKITTQKLKGGAIVILYLCFNR